MGALVLCSWYNNKKFKKLACQPLAIIQWRVCQTLPFPEMTSPQSSLNLISNGYEVNDDVHY